MHLTGTVSCNSFRYVRTCIACSVEESHFCVKGKQRDIGVRYFNIIIIIIINIIIYCNWVVTR